MSSDAGEMCHENEAQDKAIHDTNPLRFNEPDLEMPSDESADGNSTDSGESEDDQASDGQPSLHKLLLEIAEEQQPTSEAVLDELCRLLEMEKSQVNAKDANGKTALHIAVEHGLVDVAEKLIKAEADVSAEDEEKRQPLHRACLEGHARLAELLLENGAEIEAKQYQQATALDEACWKGHIRVVNLLLDKNANTQVTDQNGWSPLYSASCYGHDEVVERLLGVDKSNINATETSGGRTALHIAVQEGHANVASILLKDKKTLKTMDKNGRTPLMTATREQRADIMRMLLTSRSEDDDIQIETCDNTGQSPLIAASIDGFLPGVRQLIAAGADCNARTPDTGYTPLMCASSWRHREIVEVLLDPNCRTNVNTQGVNEFAGWTALHGASFNNNPRIVKILRDQVDVNLRAENGQTALHLASERGNESVVKLLLSSMVKPSMDEGDNDGKTALHLASAAGDEDRVESTSDMGPDDLTAEERGNEEFQSGRHGAVVQLLLENGAKPGARTRKNETTLHLSAACGDLHRLQLILGRMGEEDVLIRNDKGWTALCSAFKGSKPETAMRVLLESDLLKTADFGRVDMGNDALQWAAKDFKTHDIAKLLFQKGRRRMESPRPSVSFDWSAIEWAAHEQLPQLLSLLIDKSPETIETEEALKSALASTLELAKNLHQGAACEQLPRVLWLLIIASDQTPEIEIAMKSAFESVNKLKSQSKSPAQVQKPQDVSKANLSAPARQGKDQKGGVKERTDHNLQQTEKGLKSKDLETIKDILRDPPFAQLHKDSKKYELPQAKEGLEDVLKRFEATVVQFHKGKNESGTIRRYRPVQEVIYEEGPMRIMKSAIKNFTNLSSIINNGSGLSDHIMKPGTTPQFTTDQYHEVRSFFRDSWVEVPDRTSSSRIMRPRAMVRQQKEMTGGNPAKGERTEGEKIEAPKENKNREENKDEEQEKQIQRESKREGGETEKVQNEAKPEKDRPKKKPPGFVAASAIYMPYFCFSTNCQTENNLDEKQKNYRSLLAAYKGSVIHESPTLDEWYYHFATDKKSADDQNHRNETQIVTKFLGRDTPGRWTLLRVNQVWVWTIEDEWLITATSCLLDDSHDALVEGILNELSKQAESGGSGSQPGSATDMSRLIVNYCVGSYERRPKPQGQMSIGQTFSNYMNRIGRDETVLFEDFSRRTQSWQQQGRSNGGKDPTKSSSPGEHSPMSFFAVSSDYEIKNAIKKAEKLYCDIKDVRDELNILKSVAQYQGIVQRGLAGKREKEVDLSANYVVNDLKEMDIVADRIQSAQSEIANFQGKILMVFTFATVLFLPLSFLSSLFALDVASFQQTPAWTFVTIFIVSAAVSMVLLFCVNYWNGIISKLGPYVSNVVKRPTKAKPNSVGRENVSGTGKKDGGEGDHESHCELQTVGAVSRQQRLYNRFRGHAQRREETSV
ncbi:hypothetical protein FDECE_1366 [Fusarium decemcellulare]|nr:hypothetical protein FDECE_1366 [Fusarium decemcellulare]